MGDTDAIQGTFDYVIYNLWGMKEPNYVMRMVATVGHLLEDGETVRIWKENGEYAVENFNYKLPFDWNSRY